MAQTHAISSEGAVLPMAASGQLLYFQELAANLSRSSASCDMDALSNR